VAGVFDTTDEERRELVPSGKKGLFADRVSWALTYMKKAGLLESPKRGFYVLTVRGEQVLRDHPTRIDNTVLDEFPDFGSWRERSAAGRPKKPPSSGEESEETPEEQLDSAYLQLRVTIEADILDQVRSMSPEFFERLVVGLLVSMGYGGSLRDAGRAIGRSGDGGIDGVINEDQLGLDVIYVQAKRRSRCHKPGSVARAPSHNRSTGESPAGACSATWSRSRSLRGRVCGMRRELIVLRPQVRQWPGRYVKSALATGA
jgi:restriction system protein